MEKATAHCFFKKLACEMEGPGGVVAKGVLEQREGEKDIYKFRERAGRGAEGAGGKTFKDVRGSGVPRPGAGPKEKEGYFSRCS